MVNPAARYELVSSSSKHTLATQYPRSNVRLELSVRYEKPGTVVDTVGINRARAGSFTISILPTGRVRAQIFDPARNSTGKISNGWHMLESARAIRKGSTASIVLELYKGDVALWVDTKLASRIHLATPLSGETVYIGDFPGDDALGSRFNIHPAMVGTVYLTYFGNLDPKTYVANRGFKAQP